MCICLLSNRYYKFQPYVAALSAYIGPWGEDILRFLCLVAVVLIRFVVHTPSPADTGFPDIDPHRAGAQSTPYFAPFAGANHPLPPPYVRGTGWSRYIGPREKLTPLLLSEHAKQDLPPLNPDVIRMHRDDTVDKKKIGCFMGQHFNFKHLARSVHYKERRWTFSRSIPITRFEFCA